MFIRILSPLALLLASPALAACPAIVLTKQVEQALDEAQAQLDDADAVHAGVEHVRELLPCARMPLPASTAARLHVLVALDEAEPPAPTLAARLQAARLADPELSLPRLPPRLANVTPLWEHALDTPPEPARAASDADLGTVLALLDADGSMRLDGRVGTDRPPDRPVLVQLLDSRGVVQATGYVEAGAPIPAYPKPKAPEPEAQAVAATAETPTPAPPEQLLEPRPTRTKNLGWMPVAAGGAIALAGTGWALSERAQLMDAWRAGTEAQTWAEYNEARDAYNLHRQRMLPGIGTAAAGAGIAAIGAVVWSRGHHVAIGPRSIALVFQLGATR